MLIICPHCQHQRDIDPASVPPRAVRILCPKCGERFAMPTRRAPSAPAVKRPSAAWPAVAPATTKAEVPATAGFGLRLIALLIDGLVYGLLTIMIAIGLYLILHFTGGSNDRAMSMMSVLAFFVIIASSWLYSVFFIGYCGQTPGKMVTRIKVVRSDGGEVGFGAAIFRELVGKFISTLLLGCGYLMVLFDEKNQGLHDKIADTWVIKL